MIAVRIGIVIMGLIFAAPFIALNVWGMNMSMWANEMFGQTQAIIDGDDVIPQVREMPANPLLWLRARVDLRDTFAADRLTNERVVIIEEVVTPEELLNAGEAMPDEAFIELYAAARAPARLIPYCADILATIGSTCDVIYVETRETRDGKLELSGKLAYVPTVALGDPSTVENGKLISTRISLPYEGQIRPANDVERRQELINQAQGICDVIREQLGNCVMTQLHLDVVELWITDLEALPAGTNPQRLGATARFAVYADETKVDRTALHDLVAGIVNPS